MNHPHITTAVRIRKYWGCRIILRKFNLVASRNYGTTASYYRASSFSYFRFFNQNNYLSICSSNSNILSDSNSRSCSCSCSCSSGSCPRTRSTCLLGQQQRRARHSTNLTPQEKTRNQWKAILSQLKSMPNIITTTRILFTPYLSYLILTNQFKFALYGCVMAGFSDWVDGYIAKNYNKETVLGTYLDPLADKIFINTLALSLAMVTYHSFPLLPVCVDTSFLSDIAIDNNINKSEMITILPLWCVFTWLSRDILLIYFSYQAAAIATKGRDHNVVDPSRTPLKVDPSMMSKVNTLLQFATIGSGIGCGLEIVSIPFVHGLCYASTTTTVLSGMHYFWTGKAIVSSGNSTAISSSGSSSSTNTCILVSSFRRTLVHIRSIKSYGNV